MTATRTAEPVVNTASASLAASQSDTTTGNDRVTITVAAIPGRPEAARTPRPRRSHAGTAPGDA